MYLDMIELESLLKKPVPKKVKQRTITNVNKYCMSLGDAFDEAARAYAGKTTELYKAWYFSDFRLFLPSIYNPEYLNFDKYPLNY